MRRMILAMLTLIFCLSWAEVKVEKVLETKSIKEYNQWVQKNKAKYPGLKPYYLIAEQLKRNNEWKILYYNENGDLTKEELLKAKDGWGISVNVYPYWGRVLIGEYNIAMGESAPILNTVKDAKGNELFSFERGFDYPTGAGVNLLPGGIGLLKGNAKENYAELISWEGDKIGKIESIVFLVLGSKATPDKRFMLLNAGEFNAVLVDIAKGKELWRKNFISAIELSISDDGQYVCIGDAGAIYVYNQQGDSLYSFTFSPQGMANPITDFSSDNKYLVASAPMELALINNETGELIWRQKVEGDAYRRKVYFAADNKYVILAYLGQTYIFDLTGNMLTTIKVANSNNWEVNDDFIIINVRDDTLHKVIYQLK